MRVVNCFIWGKMRTTPRIQHLRWGWETSPKDEGDRSVCMRFCWRWSTCNQVLQNAFTSLVLLLVKRISGHHEAFSAFPDTRKYMNWAHKLAPENVYLKTSPVSLCLIIWRRVLSVFPGAQRASLLLSTLNSFQGMLKISTVAAHDLILVEEEWQVPICGWHHFTGKEKELKNSN